MKYNETQLLEMSVSSLIKIILDQQDAVADAEDLRLRLKRIMNIADVDSERPPLPKKCGRPKMSDEERAQAYERQKQRQREVYWQMKEAQKTLENLQEPEP